MDGILHVQAAAARSQSQLDRNSYNGVNVFSPSWPLRLSHTPLRLKRSFVRLDPLSSPRMDIPALSARLDSLALSSSAADSTASATPLSTYFFTPKSGSKHPGDETKELKLVVVALEHDKNLGAAKALATSVGLKDMRAISGADLEKLIGRKREEGELGLDTVVHDAPLTPSSGNSLPTFCSHFAHSGDTPHHFSVPLLQHRPPLAYRAILKPDPDHLWRLGKDCPGFPDRGCSTQNRRIRPQV